MLNNLITNLKKKICTFSFCFLLVLPKNFWKSQGIHRQKNNILEVQGSIVNVKHEYFHFVLFSYFLKSLKLAAYKILFFLLEKNSISNDF